MLALAYALTGRRENAEDVVQDAFEALHRRWADVADPGAYLRRTIVNGSTSRVRKAGSERRALTRLRGRRTEFTELEPHDADLWNAVGALPPSQRAVVALYYVEDRPINEVAQLLGIAPGTAKRALSDARAALARVLGDTHTAETR